MVVVLRTPGWALRESDKLATKKGKDEYVFKHAEAFSSVLEAVK